MRLGLKLVLVQQVNKSKVEADVERLKVRMMWDVYRKWVADERSMYGDDKELQEEEEEKARKEEERRKEDKRRKERKFEGKVEVAPGGLPN